MKVTDEIYFYKGDYKLHSIKHHNMYRGIGSSNFLVVKKNKQLLIDSGFPYGPQFKRIKKELIADNLDLMDTDMAIFSHFHPDHTKTAKLISKKKQIEFLMHKDSEKFILCDEFCFSAYFNYPKYIKKEVLVFPVVMAKGILLSLGYEFDYLKVENYFNENEKIFDDPTIETIGLYGHCPGHVGFYFPENKVLYAADLVVQLEGRSGTLLSINNAYSSLKTALEDLKKARELELDVFIPGHGDIVYGSENISSLLIEVENEVYKLIDMIFYALKNNGYLTLTKLSQVIFNKEYICNFLNAKSIVYNTLTYLMENGEVGYEVKKDKAYWYLIK